MSLATKEPAAAFPGPGRWFGGDGGAQLTKLPRFADAMVEVARALTENLAQLSASPSEVHFKGIGAGRVESLLDRKRGPSFFVGAQAAGWNTPIAFHFDQAALNVVVQALFGGSEDDLEPPERTAFSPVEVRIAHVLVDQCADALSKGFAGVLPSSFTVDPVKGKPDLSRLGKPASPVTIATLALQTLGPPVDVDIVIPRVALDAFSEELSAAEEEPAVKPDPVWSDKLETEVNRARMKLRARIDLPPMTLGAVARLEAGQVLTFGPGAGEAALLSSGGTDLFRCALGQSDGHLSLRIDEPLTEQGPSPHKPA